METMKRLFNEIGVWGCLFVIILTGCSSKNVEWGSCGGVIEESGYTYSIIVQRNYKGHFILILIRPLTYKPYIPANVGPCYVEAFNSGNKQSIVMVGHDPLKQVTKMYTDEFKWENGRTFVIQDSSNENELWPKRYQFKMDPETEKEIFDRSPLFRTSEVVDLKYNKETDEIIKNWVKKNNVL